MSSLRSFCLRWVVMISVVAAAAIPAAGATCEESDSQPPAAVEARPSVR